MNPSSKIFIAGKNGMVGSAVWRSLKSKKYINLIGQSSEKLDLRNQKAVLEFFKKERPDYVLLAAAKVGGIMANKTYRAEFIYDNIQIQNNIIHYSYVFGVKKLLFLGSSCIYPRNCNQPIKEEYLLTGELEKTNEPYAIAKIAGIKMCESYFNQYNAQFFSIMPTNVYGPNDNYNLETSHVLPALIRKFHEAKIACNDHVMLWGTGKPLREFIHVNDLADAALFVLQQDYKKLYGKGLTHLNVGSGVEISIKNLAELVAKIIDYRGEIIFNANKLDGTPRKLMNITRMLELGWKAKIKLENGIESTYATFLNENKNNN